MNSLSKYAAKMDLSGWGRYPVIESLVQRPEKNSSLHQIVKNSSVTSLLARGLGRSYGDAAINPNGNTVLTQRLNRVISLDENTGVIRCESGISMNEILGIVVPRGWFPWVIPGTKFVTLGGAVAFDVHGKNHYREGAFSRHLRSFKLILANGEIVNCSRQENSELFWATIGGMGLTGFITEVEFNLRPIQTAYLKTYSVKATNLDETLSLFQKYKEEYQYSVAWVDGLSTGKFLGRSLITFGNHATVDDVPRQPQNNLLQIEPKSKINVFFEPPSGLLNRLTIGIFNNLYYNKQLSKEVDGIVNYDSFFYPLDTLSHWNRLYGKKGFVQYQCAVPEENSREGLTTILELCSRKNLPSFLGTLKYLGHQEGLMSFPIPGYTLALDIPIIKGIWDVLDELDRIVIKYGGRLYLAKDARLSADAFRQMYPKFPQWLAIKSEVDPDNCFTSSLSQRLQIESAKKEAII